MANVTNEAVIRFSIKLRDAFFREIPPLWGKKVGALAMYWQTLMEVVDHSERWQKPEHDQMCSRGHHLEGRRKETSTASVEDR